MSSCYIILSYHIISYLMFFYFISSAALFSILFYWIRFTVLFCIVSHTNEWFVSVCPSVCSSVCVFICMNKFMFSLLSCFFILSFLFLFSLHFHFSFFTLFSHERLPHTHIRTRTRTHKYIWIYVPSYDSYILLQKPVSEESYSSDSIISYMIIIILSN